MIFSRTAPIEGIITFLLHKVFKFLPLFEFPDQISQFLLKMQKHKKKQEEEGHA